MSTYHWQPGDKYSSVAFYDSLSGRLLYWAKSSMGIEKKFCQTHIFKNYLSTKTSKWTMYIQECWWRWARMNLVLTTSAIPCASLGRIEKSPTQQVTKEDQWQPTSKGLSSAVCNDRVTFLLLSRVRWRFFVDVLLHQTLFAAAKLSRRLPVISSQSDFVTVISSQMITWQTAFWAQEKTE